MCCKIAQQVLQSPFCRKCSPKCYEKPAVLRGTTSMSDVEQRALPKKRNNAALWSHVWPIDVWTGILTELDILPMQSGNGIVELGCTRQWGTYPKWPSIAPPGTAIAGSSSARLAWGPPVCFAINHGLSHSRRVVPWCGRICQGMPWPAKPWRPRPSRTMDPLEEHSIQASRPTAAWRIWMMRNDETFMTLSTIYCWRRCWTSCPMGIAWFDKALWLPGESMGLVYLPDIDIPWIYPPNRIPVTTMMTWTSFLAAVLLALPMLTLGGGFKYVIFTGLLSVFFFHPDPWGNDPIWLPHIFSNGWFNHQLITVFLFLPPSSPPGLCHPWWRRWLFF